MAPAAGEDRPRACPPTSSLRRPPHLIPAVAVAVEEDARLGLSTRNRGPLTFPGNNDKPAKFVRRYAYLRVCDQGNILPCSWKGSRSWFAVLTVPRQAT